MSEPRSAASERDRALRDRAIANTFEGKNVMEPRADVPIPPAASGHASRQRRGESSHETLDAILADLEALDAAS